MKKLSLMHFGIACFLLIFCFVIFSYCGNLAFAADPDPALFSKLSNKLGVLYNLVFKFCQLGGAIWVLLGTIAIGGSLKDKNGPSLQSGIWQISGGIMIMYASNIFNNMSVYPKFLNTILSLASKFARLGGALWLVWGIIILGGAIKDKTGPALQSAIWQIVGGSMVMYAAEMLTGIVREL